MGGVEQRGDGTGAVFLAPSTALRLREISLERCQDAGWVANIRAVRVRTRGLARARNGDQQDEHGEDGLRSTEYE